jgi:acyl-CoA oxidase
MALLLVVAAVAAVAVFLMVRRKDSGKRSKLAGSDILLPADVAYTARCKKMLLDAVNSAAPGAIDTYEGQAAVISRLLASGLMSVDGLLRENAHELFVLHREAGPVVEGGLGVRITVQLNLFGGSVANLGNAAQRAWLQESFRRGELGCFCLTELGAGVLSGLVVDTTATFVPGACAGEAGHFDLHSPTVASRKTWISQGLTARWGVVIARLFVPDAAAGGGTLDKGPHAFLVDMQACGVVREDMPSKIDFNGLDNANVWFEHLRLDLDAMLTGISSVDAAGVYSLANPSVPFRFVEVAQRLLSGRICIAGAAINQLRKVLDAVREYGDNRLIPTGRDQTTPLSQLPVMRDTMASILGVMLVMRHFTKSVEDAVRDQRCARGCDARTVLLAGYSTALP